MLYRIKLWGLWLFFAFASGHVIKAQETVVEMARKNITLHEFFTISLTLTSQTNEKPVSGAFPVLKGFGKVGPATVTTTNYGGNGTVIHNITQRYKAFNPGNYEFPLATVLVNGKKISIPATKVSVKVAKPTDAPSEIELFEEMLGTGKAAREFIDVKEDAFFALTTDKNEVFVGEGYTVTLALYVAETNKADLDSYDQGKQITGLVSHLKPDNCWEEDFGIREYEAMPLVINKKKYSAYIFYRAAFFPLNPNPVNFPKLALTMIKYRESKEGSQPKRQDFITFYTEPRTITVKGLPPHPLREKIPAGIFRLEEEISTGKPVTGKSFRYNFRIVGTGNLAALTLPQPMSDSLFDFFTPKIDQTINYYTNRIEGSKTGSFQIISKKPGLYALKNKFSWIFFNLQTQQYDTLSSSIRINASGQNLQAAGQVASLSEPVYRGIDQPPAPSYRVSNRQIKITATVVVLLLLLGVLVFTFAGKRP